MQQETWQQLLSLESRDIVATWFKKIHCRDLNARRVKEINASAKQAREFFRNAHAANNTVKPLLTYYGVASLSRALTLLFRRKGGEEGLTRGHGLETIDWSNNLSGELSVGLEALRKLKVRTCAGLFADLVSATKNRMSMHIQSSAVGWRISYDQPKLGDEVIFEQLIQRMPDLTKDHVVLNTRPMYANINQITYSETAGVMIKISSYNVQNFKKYYEDVGYKLQEDGKLTIMTGTSQLFRSQTPQFMHAYIETMLGIPGLFLIAPFPSGNTYSQICISYIVSYILGMLARYYPTHWVSLAQGGCGDALWPTLNRAHRCIEETFPELVAEMIDDVLAHPI
ncbi:MAG: YaaC family protein [Defluviicoccus sp.]